MMSAVLSSFEQDAKLKVALQTGVGRRETRTDAGIERLSLSGPAKGTAMGGGVAYLRPALG